MKKHICERSGCHKTATVKTSHGHRICEDCAKEFRRKKIRHFCKEVLVGHIGGFDVCIDVPMKV